MYCAKIIFNWSNSTKVSMNLIERCFPMIADSNKLFELDFISFIKILSSNHLKNDSELQVLNAANSWLSHDITERSKYAKDLLSKVRLQLLAVSALNKILQIKSPFSISKECKNMIEAVLIKKQQFHSFSCNITSRHCIQSNFNIIVCGGSRPTQSF